MDYIEQCSLFPKIYIFQQSEVVCMSLTVVTEQMALPSYIREPSDWNILNIDRDVLKITDLL